MLCFTWFEQPEFEVRCALSLVKFSDGAWRGGSGDETTLSQCWPALSTTKDQLRVCDSEWWHCMNNSVVKELPQILGISIMDL